VDAFVAAKEVVQGQRLAAVAAALHEAAEGVRLL
jgi:hypothetical protein